LLFEKNAENYEKKYYEKKFWAGGSED